MPFQNNVLAGASGATGYEVPYSLRFRRSNNAAMTRTAGAPTNAKIATWSFWHKRGALGPEWVWGESTGGASTFFTFDSSAPDTIRIQVRGANLTSTPVFRDPSAWYHFVVAVDTTQATAADRIKVYANNQVVTMSGTITLNADITFNESGKSIKISNGAGWFATSADYIDGYLAEFNFIDGQALTPSSFGQTDATTGVWVPKKYAGTYGANGFYLKFADASAATATAIGKDSSGNGNNWTPSGISVTSGTTFDQMTDTPTLNYAVWSVIDKATVTVSEANMAAVPAADVHAIRATMALPATGKWYWEVAVSALGYGTGLGIADNASNLTANASSPETRTYQFGSWFNSFNGGVVQYGTNQNVVGATNWTAASQPAANDVIMVAVDMDNGSMWVGKNGTWFNSSGTANPATNTDPRWTGLSGTTWFPYMAGYGTATPVTCRINSGQRAFSYTPPSGFKALNTTNLPTPSIKKGSIYFDATLRTGTGATASVSSLNFQPDLVWIKSRSAATDHGLYDAVRGVQKQIESNTITAETTETTGLTAFNSNGYTVGALAQLNTSAATYVDWAWKEGATPGFDIVTWTADGTSPRNISHSLGAIPKLIITKQRSPSADNWFTYHASLGATKNVRLDETVAALTQVGAWNDTEPTSTQFTTGNFVNFTTNGNTLVAYLWSEIEGFSKFGSYTGNGSTDGPFVWCGFRPRYLLLKNSSNVSWWITLDAARNNVNAVTDELLPNSNNAENGLAITSNIDFLASGFKIRTSDANLNQSPDTLIFAAFAENPFKYARAR